jgi:hypothetical protein
MSSFQMVKTSQAGIQTPLNIHLRSGFQMSSQKLKKSSSFLWFAKLNYNKNGFQMLLTFRAEIHQALLSKFSILAEFFIGKVTVKD